MTFSGGQRPFPSGNGPHDANGHAPAEANTEVFQPMSLEQVADTNEERSKKKRHVWPWVLSGALLAAAAVCGGGYAYFQNHALPGSTLWGTDMTGKSHQQIVDQIDQQVASTNVPVKYDGKTVNVNLHDLGVDVDSDDIANQVIGNKRDSSVLDKYNFWNKKDVNPEVKGNADADSLNEKLGIEATKPVDASVKLNAAGDGFEVIPATDGKGADPQPVAKAAIEAVKTLNSNQPQAMDVTYQDIKPQVTNEIADQAKETLTKLNADPVAIKVQDTEIGKVNAAALMDSARIDPNESSVAQNERRNGVVVFNADKLQKFYEDNIKKNLKTEKEDRDVIVNNNGDVMVENKAGHDGVKLAANADNQVGASVADSLANGKNSVELKGTVDKMKTKETKRHAVVDLSDGKLYAYENGKKIKEFHISAGQGNSRATGECVSQGGDLCTPTGDFEVWLKYPSQDMSGNLTLSNGKKESWDVKNVGFVNYFSHSGCAIHRIATDSEFTDADIARMNANTSHGCVGIGWDVAPWFYDFAKMSEDGSHGLSVHVQA